ncbi:MAG: hypothetical protein ABR599_03855 [Gemmatimonadota bacterium]
MVNVTEVGTRTLAAALLALVVVVAMAVLALVAAGPGPDELRARAGELQSARTLERSTFGSSTLEELRLVSTSGLTARCAARAPRATGGSAGTDRHPAFLLVAGYETGRRAVEFPEVGGVVLLACDYPLRLPERLTARAFWSSLSELRRGVLDTPPTLLLALDYLAAREDVDPGSLAIVGASVGVPPATVATALDRRVGAVALLYGGADLPLLFAHNVDLGNAWANRAARAAVAVITRPVEPARFAPDVTPRPALAVNARQDPFIPIASARALHRALREPKEVRWLELDHVAAFHERTLLAGLTALAREWFREQGVA